MELLQLLPLAWLGDAIAWLQEMYAIIAAYGDQFLAMYVQWGPFAWLFAAWVESVFPFLLLSLITVINIQAAQIMMGPVWGWIVGFLLSWIGTTLGSIFMFSFWRYFSGKIRILRDRQKRKQSKDYEKVAFQSKKGIIGLFSISAIPMLPSSLINFTYAFTKMKTKVFIKTTIIAKFFMMLFMSIFAGFFEWLFTDLWRAALSSILILGFAFLLNKYEDHFVAAVKKIAYRSKALRRIDEEDQKHMEETLKKEETTDSLD